MKLISMTDFVLQDNGSILNMQYANFLKQPLELWMFVPCDEDGNVIDESYNDKQHVIIQHLEYAEAKERCLFDEVSFNFETKYEYYLISNKGYNMSIHKKMKQSIESLIKYDLQLTKSAINKLGL